MSALYFASSDRTLFGYYHAPARETKGAVLLCQPWGTEYQNAHRTMRILARQLADEGHHVLRFDYSGTGDSWGATTDADSDAWTGEAEAALDELRSMSGRDRVDLVGLRLGAFVAARVAATRGDVGRVVLWDPIVDGAAWLHELEPAGLELDGEDGWTELGSNLVSSRFVNQLEAIRPGAFFAPIGAELFILRTHESTATGGPDPLPHLPTVQSVWLPQPPPWLEEASLSMGQVPVEAVKRIAGWLR